MSTGYEQIDGSVAHPHKRALRVLMVICLVAAATATTVFTIKTAISDSHRPAGPDAPTHQPQATLTCGLVAAPGMKSVFLPSGREYLVHVPAQITYPASVVFAWHGLGEKPQTMEDRIGLMALADAGGFLAVFPQAKNKGVAAAWNGAACCKNDASFQDVQFAQDIINSLAAQGCVDPLRAFSFGFSNGGFLSHRIACEQSTVFAAICPHSGVNGDYSGDLNKSPWTKCDTSGPKKVPVMGVHGTNDRLVPIAGGKNPTSAAAWFSFNDTMAIWEKRHGCSDPISESLVGTDGRNYVKRSFANCDVISLTVINLAHEWWVDSNSNCMAFFRQHGL